MSKADRIVLLVSTAVALAYLIGLAVSQPAPPEQSAETEGGPAIDRPESQSKERSEQRGTQQPAGEESKQGKLRVVVKAPDRASWAEPARPAEEQGRWTVFEDSRSSFQENSIFDLVQAALRRPDADSVDFRITFRQGVPDSGNVTLWIDTDLSPSTGKRFWGDIGADQTITVSLGEGRAVPQRDPSTGREIAADYRVAVDRAGNELLIRVRGWKSADFDFVVMENATATKEAVFSYPWNADQCPIRVDGKTDDWNTRQAIWTASQAELPQAVSLADIRRVWVCSQGESLFGRVEFPRRSALYGDPDISHGEPTVSLTLDVRGPQLRYIMAKRTTVQFGPRKDPPDGRFESHGPDVEFEFKDRFDLSAAGSSRDIRISTHMQKIDFIPDGARHGQGHLEFRSREK